MSEHIQAAIAVAEGRMTVSRLGKITALETDKDLLAFRKIKSLLESAQTESKMATKTHILTGPGMGPSVKHLRTWLAEHVPLGVDESAIQLNVSHNGDDWKLMVRIEDLT